MATKLRVARWMIRLANILVALGGIILIAIGIWTMNDKSFVDELLRNNLYMNTTYIILISACFMIILACFGGFAATKEVRCLLLTHFVLTLLLFVVLLIGGILAYVFKDQVENTMKAEMIADIRNYDPDNQENPVTQAWDQTQRELSCCGFMTEQVTMSWQMWRQNRKLNPTAEYQMVPASCCRPDPNLECFDSSNMTAVEESLVQGDCYVLALHYVRGHASTLGGAAIGVSALLMLSMIASLFIFKSIV